MVYKTIKFTDGQKLQNVLSCDEAPPRPGFIPVWVNDDIVYLNERYITHYSVYAPELKEKMESNLVKAIKECERAAGFTNEERW
mgnify:CR=1 FL=1